MFVETTLGTKPSSPLPDDNLDHQLEGPPPALLHPSPPCWLAQVQRDLAQAEVELRCLQERHKAEIDSVSRGVERAILGARSEERRLLERVEQDYRDTQQHLEQVQKDNLAAIRVSQSLLSHRFQNLAQLQQHVTEVGQRAGVHESGRNQTLLTEVAEFLQPWEISVSLKKVNFKPSSQTNAITFGDIRVQEQSLCLSVGGCGPQGQLCALHSHEMDGEDLNRRGAGVERSTFGQRLASPTGRVFRKINISTEGDLDPEEQKFSPVNMSHWRPKCEQADWESCQDDETESASFQSQGVDAFMSVPTRLQNMDTGGTEQMYKMNRDGKPHSPRNQRRPLTVASGKKPSPSPSPERRLEHAGLSSSLDTQDGSKLRASPDSNKRLLSCGNKVITSPKMTAKEPRTSRSCVDLTSRSQTHSCLSQSSDEHSLGTHGDSGRAPSPTDSLDSSYTFIVSSSHDYNSNRGSLKYRGHLSKSAVDLSHKTEPLLRVGSNDHAGEWRQKCGRSMSTSVSTSPTHSGGCGASDTGRTLSCPTYKSPNLLHQPQRKIPAAGSRQPPVARSLSMSVIDGSSRDPKRARGERAEPTLFEMEEEGTRYLTEFNHRGVRLIRQFGKQGSGRADLTLPSGIHATPQGLLFIVDCGNARVQVCCLECHLSHKIQLQLIKTHPNFGNR